MPVAAIMVPVLLAVAYHNGTIEGCYRNTSDLDDGNDSMHLLF